MYPYWRKVTTRKVRNVNAVNICHYVLPASANCSAHTALGSKLKSSTIYKNQKYVFEMLLTFPSEKGKSIYDTWSTYTTGISWPGKWWLGTKGGLNIHLAYHNICFWSQSERFLNFLSWYFSRYLGYQTPFIMFPLRMWTLISPLANYSKSTDILNGLIFAL